MEPCLLVNGRQLWRVPGCDLRPVTSPRVCFLICDEGKWSQRARTFHEQLMLGKTCLGAHSEFQRWGGRGRWIPGARSLASQSRLLGQLQASERPHLRKQGVWLLMGITKVVSMLTCIHSHISLHTATHTFPTHSSPLMHTRTHRLTCTHSTTCMHTYLHTQSHTYMNKHLHMDTHVHMHTHIYAHTYAHTHSHKHTC